MVVPAKFLVEPGKGGVIGLTPIGAIMRATYGGVILCPYYGLAGIALRHLGEICGMPDLANMAQIAPGVVGALGITELVRYVLESSQQQAASRPKPPAPLSKKEITLNGMPYDQVALVCNLLIFGGIRSGKTSGTLDWATDQLLRVFNDPGDELGGFFLDVKGNRTTRVLKFAHDAGRNVIKSCKVIRPNCSLPYVKMQDEETGHMFFIPAVEYSTGSESARFLVGTNDPDTGEPLPANLFSWSYWQIEPFELKLKRLRFDVSQKDVRYIGWRREGNDLVRVNRTIGAYKETEYNDHNGQRVRIRPPKILRYVGVGYIDNGLHYNIVNNNIEPSEAAKRLRLIGQLLNNGKTGGDNKFWDDGAEGHVLYCIEMLKIVNEPGIQVDGSDIARLTTQKQFWAQKNELLKKKIEELKKRIEVNTETELSTELEERLKKYTDIKAYFEEEWVVMEGKTKTIMTQVIKQLFNAFLLDGKLQKAFGSKATYSFVTAITKGDLFIFGGCEYETLAKMVGTALKMDFQSCVLSRTSNKHINQSRYILFENDECHEFAVAGVGSGVGDDRTMSLAGESLLINLLATQTIANLEAVLGRDRTRIYVGACGGLICYHVTDYGTAEEISKKIPEVTREHRELTSSELKVSTLLSQDAKMKEHITFKKESRFTPNDFMTLNIREWESIAYNKTMLGDLAKAHRQINIPHPIGSPAGKRDLDEFMRWYECASVEQLAWDQERPGLFDHISKGAAPSVAAPSESSSTQAPFVPEAIPSRTATVEFKGAAKKDLLGERASASPTTAPTPPPSAQTKPSAPSAPLVPPAAKPVSAPQPEKQPQPPAPPPRYDVEPGGITMGDIDKARQAYADPAVIGEFAKKLTASLGLSLEGNYHEFLESKASGVAENEKVPIAGPSGLVVGNPQARQGASLPTVHTTANDHQRLASLRHRMDELALVQKTASEPGTHEVSPEAAERIADDDSTGPNLLDKLKGETF